MAMHSKPSQKSLVDWWVSTAFESLPLRLRSGSDTTKEMLTAVADGRATLLRSTRSLVATKSLPSSHTLMQVLPVLSAMDILLCTVSMKGLALTTNG